MPRKIKARGGRQNKKVKKITEEKEQDEIIEKSTNKIDKNYLSDFEREVEHRVAEMRYQMEIYKKNLGRSMDLLLSETPKEVRSKTLKQLLEEEEPALKENETATNVASVVAYVNMKTQEYISSRNQNAAKDSVFAKPAAATGSIIRTQRKRQPLAESRQNVLTRPSTAIKAKKAIGASTTLGVRSSARLRTRQVTDKSQQAFMTPAAKMAIAELSSTAASKKIKSRIIRPGEICVSINGSPVTIAAEQTPISKRSAMENAMQLLSAKRLPANINKTTLKEINRLKEKMDRILLRDESKIGN